MDAADHQLNTRVTNEIYIRRVLLPTLGSMPLRKLQHRVDIIDRLYTHLRRCSELCDGRPFTVHTLSDAHNCATAKCQPHICRPMASSTVRRIHATLFSALFSALDRASGAGECVVWVEAGLVMNKSWVRIPQAAPTNA